MNSGEEMMLLIIDMIGLIIPSYLSIILFRRQPPIENELKLLVGLNIPDQDSHALPGGELALSGVVVPDAHVRKISQGSVLEEE